MSAGVRIALVALAAAACSPRDRRTPDDTLIVLTDTPITTADPRYASTNYDSKLVRLVAPGLTTIESPSLEPTLALAQAITRVDGRGSPAAGRAAEGQRGGADDVTYEATIRADAKFSDGTAVTADDVVQTYRSVLAADSASKSHRDFSERYRDVEPCGDRCVRFHLYTPLGTLMSDLDFGIVSFHSDPALGVVGAGPYAVRAIATTTVYLDANPYYYGAHARTPHVEIRYVADASARITMLVGGSADLAQNSVRADLVDAVAARPRVQLEHGASCILTYLMMNNDAPALRDVRVRQAIALALDRPAIIAAALDGHAVLATGLLPPDHWAYAADVEHWQRDLPRARALLDAAGLPPDASGVRVRFTYKTSSDAFRVSLARVIAAQLAEVGIAVEVRPFEFATFFADIKRGEFELASMQTAEITDPDYYYGYFNSSRIPTPADPDAGNRWRYRNPEVDALTQAGRREPDRDRRRAIYAQVQRDVARDVPIIALWHEDNIAIANRDVDGYRVLPNARLAALATAVKRAAASEDPR